MSRVSINLIVLLAILVAGPRGRCAQPQIERLPPPSESEAIPVAPAPADSESVFPSLPPDPNESDEGDLPPLEDELWLHGGPHLYVPEGEGFYVEHGQYAHGPCHELGRLHHEPLRLPEDWQAPQPFTLFADFLGADPIRPWPALSWPGAGGYALEPRGVVYGAYQIFGFAFQEGSTRQDAVGHQLLLDFDLRLTGTERLHVQYRPIGEKNSGGSYYQFNSPSGYVDNSTGAPERYWVEAELASVLGGWFCDPFVPRDFHITAGVFPFSLQNNLLMNDDVAGVVVNKNTIYLGGLSNLNAQWFYFFDDVDAYTDGGANVFGTNCSADYKRVFYELAYAYRTHSRDATQDSHYVAISGTKLLGRMTLAGRAMFKWGDAGGSGAGQLLVLESNWTRRYDSPLACRFDVTHGVYYANAFCATKGWSPISGGNFDRLRNSFAVNPLVTIARGLQDDTCGLAAGVQWFRHHEDQSLTPEVAYEAPGGTSVWGAGLRYQRKTGPRSFFEVNGVLNWSSDPSLERDGVFMSETIVF